LNSPSPEDLSFVYEKAKQSFLMLKNQRVFLTGGTGFFGKSILESIKWANEFKGANISVVVLSRSISKFKLANPVLSSHNAFSFVQGDVRDFQFPFGNFDYIIHAATDADVRLNRESPREMLDVLIRGTERVLEFARLCSPKRLLLTSSGAVYGVQPFELSRLPESFAGAPATTSFGSAYGEGKRVSELMAVLAGQEKDFDVCIARCFSFIGPYLPLDSTYAAGNFIRDGLRGGPIVVQGDGTSVRSYLYSSDLVAWLLTLLVSGASGQVFNVGSDEEVSVAELASLIADEFGGLGVVIGGGSEGAATRYVPSVLKAEKALNLQPWTSLRASIRKTIAWHQNFEGRP
jgi:nucleoside-diphosphate-sugar epimerase